MTEIAPQMFDLIVIGSGPGGHRAAMQAAKIGKKVAVIEENEVVGGACVHKGTLPSKSFRESVYRFSLSARGTLGRASEHHSKVTKKRELPDFARLTKRAERVVNEEAQVIYEHLKRNEVQIIHGRAKLVSNHDVEVTSKKGVQKLTADFIIVAVGARPVAPEHIPVDGKHILDSNTILDLKKMPKSIVVLGGGIIGCEYASMFSTAGTKVYLVDRRHEILASVDRELVSHLTELFEGHNLETILGAEAQKVEILPKKGGRNRVRVTLSNKRKIEAEAVLVSLGRLGNTQNMGLEEVGVEVDARGTIKVNQYYQTKVPSIYAVGDVIGAPALAATSLEQGRLASGHAFGLSTADMAFEFGTPKLFPYGIYTIPEISMIGITEEEAKAQGKDFVCGRAFYRELARGQIVGDYYGILKLIVERKSMKILGVHILGDNAADLIHIGQAVMSLGGDLHYFVGSVFNYPTLAEAYKTAGHNAMNQIRGYVRGTGAVSPLAMKKVKKKR